MTSSHDMANFLWEVANLLRGPFKRGKYADVILPFTVLRRLDCVLEPTKDRVLERYHQYKDKDIDLYPILRPVSGFGFYNTSRYDFGKLLGDANNLHVNLIDYLNGFSPNMRDVLEKFDLVNTIEKLARANLLYLIVEKFKKADLHPSVISNTDMGYVFEELIRRFNEASDENPGEHFTPPEVVQLMVNLVLEPDADRWKRRYKVITVYDPCCGTGRMLTTAKAHILEKNPAAEVHLFGQEVNPETYAICKSDLFMTSADGRDADNIMFGSTFGEDKHSGEHFFYMLANPPYGDEWKPDEAVIRAEHNRGELGRFAPGLPRISDGQLLFLLHMLAKMKAGDSDDGRGSRVAIVMNGSPLFTGDAGSGESEIRRWIIEHDWLETIVALPEQIFYNTGITTYIWVLTNHKAPERQGVVTLIDAADQWQSMRKSLGDKRREMNAGHLATITALAMTPAASERVKTFPGTAFGYRKIQIERPLRKNFQVTPERLAKLTADKAWSDLARKNAGHQDQVRDLFAAMPTAGYRDKAQFEADLLALATTRNVALPTPLLKAIFVALGEKDATAMTCLDKDGHPEPDPDLRDSENVPLGEDIDAYFDREVRPHIPDAWIDRTKRDKRDGQVGIVGYEINFNRYFYTYTPPRPLAAIETDIHSIERDILALLREVVG